MPRADLGTLPAHPQPSAGALTTEPVAAMQHTTTGVSSSESFITSAITSLPSAKKEATSPTAADEPSSKCGMVGEARQDTAVFAGRQLVGLGKVTQGGRSLVTAMKTEVGMGVGGRNRVGRYNHYSNVYSTGVRHEGPSALRCGGA